MKKIIRLKVNGKEITKEVDTNITLLEFIRDYLNLHGTKLGCGNGECGACTIIMDGKPIRSCIILALEADGSEILTIEGITKEDELHPIQEAFIEQGAVQCGYCTPGMIMATKALLDANLDPNHEDIEQALGGHICRCTGYKHIIDAVKLSKDLININKQ